LYSFIPTDIYLKYSSLSLIKRKYGYSIFFGVNEIGSDVVIKIRNHSRRDFLMELESDDEWSTGLRGYIRLYKKIKHKEWAPLIIESYVVTEDEITSEIVIEKKYYQADYFGSDIIDKDQLLEDIEGLLVELHELGISHRDVALRNICYNHDTGHYILIDYNDAIDNTEFTIEEELVELRKELDSIDN
jgi:hypothetical protein